MGLVLLCFKLYINHIRLLYNYYLLNTVVVVVVAATILVILLSNNCTGTADTAAPWPGY
jgi:hypothetical protein